MIPSLIDYLEVRDVTEFSKERPKQKINYTNHTDETDEELWKKLKTYIEYYDAKTPVRDHSVLSKRANDSSYSPWKYIINRDNNR